MIEKNQNDDVQVEQLLDELLDAAEKEREQRLSDIEKQEPALAARARKLLAYALGEGAPVSETVDRVAPDLFAALVNEDEHDRIGQTLGPYRITEFIGRGGMGVVFLAERSDGAYEQSVAIKFTPRFVRSEHSRLLFERERAHLARLEHPNIARIIDAGVTEDETPYYIMEYVDGERIDHFAGGLPERERLLLFLHLCDAVAYCHRSLIIHGDIKPSNVLVSDNRVRLLDFGIGHLLDEAEPNEALADVHAFSPDYAAPEQREGDHPSIQSDIYSLGTLLQKLFTGEAPEDIAAIIGVCREDSPQSRYPSVDALHRDINAYLDHYPVSARSPTRRYRSARFVRRNRLLVAGTAAIIAGLGAGLGIAVWQYDIARNEATRAQQVAVFLKSLFERAGPYNSGEQDVTVLEIMDDAAARVDKELPDAPDVRTEVKQLIASGYYGIGEYEKSLEMRQEALAYWQENRRAPDIEIVGALNDLGYEHSARGEYDAAAAASREAIEQLDALDMSMTEAASHSWTRLATSLSRSDPEGSLAAMRRAHEINLAIYPDDGKVIARSLANIAFGLRATGNYREAATVSEEALALADANGERLATDIIDTRCNLALDYSQLGLGDKARVALRECIALGAERLGSDHPDLVAKYNNLGQMELMAGRLAEAEEPLEAAVTLAATALPETSIYRLAAEINYSLLLWQSGRAGLAEPYARAALGNMEKSLGPGHPASGRVRTVLGRIVLELAEHEEALRLIEPSLEGLSAVWRADALLWLAEAKLAVDEDESAAALASESLEIRRNNDGTPDWQIAEAQSVLATANGDEAMQEDSRTRLEQELPPGHIRRN